MFRSYFMAALRTLLKNRGLTAINILGLAIGMASVILMASTFSTNLATIDTMPMQPASIASFALFQWKIPHRSVRVHLAHWHRH